MSRTALPGPESSAADSAGAPLVPAAQQGSAQRVPVARGSTESGCALPLLGIALGGEIDPAMVIALHRRINDALDAGEDRVVLDLSAVTVLGGRTASLFCGVLRRLSRRGATVAIAGAPHAVQRILAQCGIDRLEQYSTGTAALMAVMLESPSGAALPAPTLPSAAVAPSPAFSQ